MMIRIPFTKIEVSWQLLAILVLFLVFAQTWWRGLLAFVGLVGGLWLFSLIVWWLGTMLLFGKHRRPGEGLRALSARMLEPQHTEHSFEESFQQALSYRYVEFDCGHTVFDRFPKGIPQANEQLYCPGHRKFGPAQQQTVVEVMRFLPEGDRRKVLR